MTNKGKGWGGGGINIDFYLKEALELISGGEGGGANIICERSLIVIVGGNSLHKVRRGDVLSDLSGFKCPRSLMSAGTNIREQISRGKKCQITPVCISLYVWQACVETKMFVKCF